MHGDEGTVLPNHKKSTVLSPDLDSFSVETTVWGGVNRPHSQQHNKSDKAEVLVSAEHCGFSVFVQR